MQTQDAPAELIFKFWPWFEANRKRLIIAGVAAVVGGFVWFYISTQKQQAEQDAGLSYTQLQLSMPPNPTTQQVVDGYLKIAGKYAGTLAGQRARLQAGALQFGAGNYADAQTQFQSFLTAETGSPLAALARMGVASSLEAQGKLDDALAAYRAVVAGFPDSTDAIVAKFSQGRVLELQGKLSEAVTFYQDAARSPLAGSLASEAGKRIALIQVKLASAKPAIKAAPATKS
ncbi:MAG TPA: tetratricopeptide repeat protein [Verrucomicrobiae bacterium]|jgi:predicted negative regulator of RcsB-dependent stress response